MNSKYKIAIIIGVLLVVLSISITSINYFVSLNNTQQQLKNQALPLSLDNIYTEIQKHIIEPYLVSSMMANDTFVQDWLINDEENYKKIENYLSAIKNKYQMFTTYLVSNKSKNYYTQDGFIETMTRDNPSNNWYFSFKQKSKNHEINLDFNKNLSNSLIMFINYKIFDRDYSFLGSTGVAIKISYINDMLKTFRQKYHFKVFFINKDADIVLSEKDNFKYSSLSEIDYLNSIKDDLISKESKSFEYQVDGKEHILNTKYIPELDLYLLVEAKTEDFLVHVKDIFYFNLIISLFISFFIIITLVYLIKNYNKKLEHLADYDMLTSLNNRRSFKSKLSRQISIHQRNKNSLSLVFIDIDDFKTINDNFGHEVGDKVLIRISNILKNSVRKSDLVARWGGEEFIIVFINSTLEDSIVSIEKIKGLIQSDYLLTELAGSDITASFGVTQLKEKDSIDSIINRADQAMYRSKRTGKNKIESI
ncbi:GGDEF domain-containing protein [Malaciobacter pacificus]|uniref:diguanylate cyclase n=1 Tax=Malaciobacter pacificus TaxID=1080223 RepID=A0A5C2HGB6_9BACT|nr:sensor domain-containing diguanylate cyclase [Malaciobacter pacificus]QEP35452.1 Cache sensor-containing diguanylate cyclase [Malaciobacter pacificus]GGD49154.1 GGDEF domain-containing protein [Malaciobacter pacificus]